MKVIIVIISALFLTACQPNDYSPLKVSLYNQANDPVGTAIFTEEASGVAVKVSVEGLTPGLHGIHIHEYAKCEAPDFKSAGSHYNPAGNEHGLMHPDGAHLGDMPNIEVGSDGTAEAEFELAEATLSEGQYSLLQDDGTSIVIHDKQDDGVSQPSGDAGERVVCGKITLDEAKEDMPPTDPTETDKKKEEE